MNYISFYRVFIIAIKRNYRNLRSTDSITMILYAEILLIIALIVMLLLMLLLSRFFLQRTMIVPARLFHAALKNENEGRFEEAELGYRSALDEVKRKRFQNRELKNAIVQKLKILNTVIEYNQGRKMHV